MGQLFSPGASLTACHRISSLPLPRVQQDYVGSTNTSLNPKSASIQLRSSKVWEIRVKIKHLSSHHHVPVQPTNFPWPSFSFTVAKMRRWSGRHEVRFLYTTIFVYLEEYRDSCWLFCSQQYRIWWVPFLGHHLFPYQSLLLLNQSWDVPGLDLWPWSDTNTGLCDVAEQKIFHHLRPAFRASHGVA